MEAFVYRWRNCQTREWYIGYHLGSADDGYICSSETARPRIQQEPELWQRRILRWGTKREMIGLKRKILTKLNARSNSRSLNRSNGNGTMYGGRPRGSRVKNWDLNGSILNTLTAEEIITKLMNETDPNRRLKIHQWIFKKVT